MAVQCGLSWLALTTVVFLSLWTSLSEAQIDTCPCDVDFQSNDLCTCQVHGEPHITMCNRGRVTCSSPGYQVYLSTPYMLITGVNTYWPPGSQEPTALTEAIIEFRSLTTPYAITYRYRALNGNIPTSFEYQATNIAAIDVVTLVISFNPPVAELTWPYLNIAIRLTAWQSALYSLTVGGACNALNNGIGILVHGCPRCEQIDIGMVRARRRRNADTAEQECLDRGVPAEGIMMNRCMYDVIMTGDPEIAGATVNAIEDGERVAEMIANAESSALGEGCPDGQFTCLDGTCIDMPLRCNGRPDCGDGSDEEGCGCPDGQFTCLDGTCIDMALRCNGIPDCRDGSDEEGCGGEEMRA